MITTINGKGPLLILVCLLLLFGLITIFGSMATAYWLASQSCAKYIEGCQRANFELFIDLMFSWMGIVFWATVILGIFIVWWGIRVKTHHL